MNSQGRSSYGFCFRRAGFVSRQHLGEVSFQSRTEGKKEISSPELHSDDLLLIPTRVVVYGNQFLSSDQHYPLGGGPGDDPRIPRGVGVARPSRRRLRRRAPSVSPFLKAPLGRIRIAG
jgi:hypothetical protein